MQKTGAIFAAFAVVTVVVFVPDVAGTTNTGCCDNKRDALSGHSFVIFLLDSTFWNRLLWFDSCRLLGDGFATHGVRVDDFGDRHCQLRYIGNSCCRSAVVHCFVGVEPRGLIPLVEREAKFFVKAGSRYVIN